MLVFEPIKMTLAKAMSWFRPAPVPDFDPLEPWDPRTPYTLERRIAEAEAWRERSSEAAEIDRLIEELESDLGVGPTIYLQEEITPGHDYMATMIFERDGAMEVVTNRGRRGPPLLRYRLPPSTPRRQRSCESAGR